MFSVQEVEDDYLPAIALAQARWAGTRLCGKESILMLNGLEQSLEKHLPESERLLGCTRQVGRWIAQGGSSFLSTEHSYYLRR